MAYRQHGDPGPLGFCLLNCFLVYAGYVVLDGLLAQDASAMRESLQKLIDDNQDSTGTNWNR